MKSHGSSPAAQTLVDDDREFVGCLGAQQLQARPAALRSARPVPCIKPTTTPPTASLRRPVTRQQAE